MSKRRWQPCVKIFEFPVRPSSMKRDSMVIPSYFKATAISGYSNRPVDFKVLRNSEEVYSGSLSIPRAELRRRIHFPEDSKIIVEAVNKPGRTRRWTHVAIHIYGLQRMSDPKALKAAPGQAVLQLRSVEFFGKVDD